MHKQQQCPVCDSLQQQVFLQRQQVPVQQNNLYASPEEAKNCSRGELRMTFCKDCGFVYNAGFDPKLMQYSSSYNNTQEASGHFVAHLEQMKQRLFEAGVSQATIVEAGCGKGYFLKSLIADAASGNCGIGFDPTYEGEETMYDGRLRFVKKYFDHSCIDLNPDIVVCRHVIEHVPAPREFLAEIKLALKKAPDCRLFFETPCINWILATKTIWDFFYEHCSIFSAASLKYLFEKTGFSVSQVVSVFSDQYLWLEAANCGTVAPAADSGTTARLLQEFIVSEQQQVRQWRELLQAGASSGTVVVWGAGAKGVTFVNLLDPKRELISCLIDVNSGKQGRFTPGTAHAVVPVEHLQTLPNPTIVVMNPNYLGEIAALLKRHGINAQLITEPGEPT